MKPLVKRVVQYGLNPERQQTFAVIRCLIQTLSYGESRKRSILLPFPKTKLDDLKLKSHHEIVDSLDDFKVKSLTGGQWRRPELRGAFSSERYDKEAASRYTKSQRSQKIQREMTSTAVDLLNVAPAQRSSSLVVDVGCGSGISSHALHVAGFHCVGFDVSPSMLMLFSRHCSKYATSRLSNAVLCDVSRPLPVRGGTVDGVVSISALQWLFVLENPEDVFRVFLGSVQKSLRPEGKAVIQFYPRCRADVEMVWRESKGVFPTGALIGCHPSPDRGRKLFLLLINSQQN